MKLPDFNSKDEKPLDTLLTDEGFCGIFRSIGIVGDSLASGEMEIISDEGTRSYYDMYEYSWGQYMARRLGCRVENFSRGGMTAQCFCDSFGMECGAFSDKERVCQCYIIALGVNDANSGLEMGSSEDAVIENCYTNKKTVAGCYGQIISRIKILQPDAKIFLMTPPREPDPTLASERWQDDFRKIIYEMKEKFQNTYVLDLREYAPVQDQAFRDMFYLNGHLNAAGYEFMAKIIMSYMDYIIRHHFDDFRKVALIGTPHLK